MTLCREHLSSQTTQAQFFRGFSRKAPPREEETALPTPPCSSFYSVDSPVRHARKKTVTELVCKVFIRQLPAPQIRQAGTSSNREQSLTHLSLSEKLVAWLGKLFERHWTFASRYVANYNSWPHAKGAQHGRVCSAALKG